MMQTMGDGGVYDTKTLVLRTKTRNVQDKHENKSLLC
jgi:hypothetical protein